MYNAYCRGQYISSNICLSVQRYGNIQSLHPLQILSNSELSISLSPNLIHIDTRRQLRQRQLALFTIYLKHTLYSSPISLPVYQSVSSLRKEKTHQVSNYRTNALCPCQRQVAFLDNLRGPIFRNVAGRNDNFGVARIGD